MGQLQLLLMSALHEGRQSIGQAANKLAHAPRLGFLQAGVAARQLDRHHLHMHDHAALCLGLEA